jgi:hypothetical protein
MTENPNCTPPFDYSWAEFDEHMHRFLTEDESTDVESYFWGYYSRRDEAKWKMVRFVAACSFFQLNHGRFGNFYIKGGPDGKGVMVSPHLIGALWRYYAAAPDDLASPLVPLEQILELAREASDR